MRYLSWMLVLFFSFLLASCLTIEEKITFKKDGSGTFQTFVDMSEMLTNPMVLGSLQEEMKKDGKDASDMKVDSVINFLDELKPSNPQWTAEELAMLEKMESRMKIDLEAGVGGIYFNYDFKNINDLMKVQELMTNAKKAEGDEENPMSGGFGSGGMMSNLINMFTWKKGRFSRTADLPADPLESMNMPDGDETMNMMKMMMGDAKVIYKMEFPGKIKKVKGFPGHTIEAENTLLLEFGFLEMLEDPDNINDGLDGEVKFKNK